jgi:hypothetical protein
MGKILLNNGQSGKKVLHHPFYMGTLQKQTHPDEFCKTQRRVIKHDKCNMLNKYSCVIFLHIRHHGIKFIKSSVQNILHVWYHVKPNTQQWKNSGQVQCQTKRKYENIKF